MGREYWTKYQQYWGKCLKAWLSGMNLTSPGLISPLMIICVKIFRNYIWKAKNSINAFMIFKSQVDRLKWTPPSISNEEVMSVRLYEIINFAFELFLSTSCQDLFLLFYWLILQWVGYQVCFHSFSHSLFVINLMIMISKLQHCYSFALNFLKHLILQVS